MKVCPLTRISSQAPEICPTSPGNLWFEWKQIATVLILPQCNSMMYLK